MSRDQWPVAGAECASGPSPDLRARVVAILNDPDLDDPAGPESKAERIEALIAAEGWEPVLACLCDLLHRGEGVEDWLAIADVFWGAVLDRRPMPADRVIALLYGRFKRAAILTDHSDNLLWSITCKLKGVGYLSEYEPLRDPAVRSELAALWPES